MNRIKGVSPFGAVRDNLVGHPPQHSGCNYNAAPLILERRRPARGREANLVPGVRYSRNGRCLSIEPGVRSYILTACATDQDSNETEQFLRLIASGDKACWGSCLPAIANGCGAWSPCAWTAALRLAASRPPMPVTRRTRSTLSLH